jgi:hypothetical protein
MKFVGRFKCHLLIVFVFIPMENIICQYIGIVFQLITCQNLFHGTLVHRS